MRVADLGLDPRIVEILKKQGIEELYPPQADAIGPALLGENLVLAIPTASGKSLVAYLAILASVLRKGKALYIVPLRALAAEKYEDLKEFEPLGIKVGISVGTTTRLTRTSNASTSSSQPPRGPTASSDTRRTGCSDSPLSSPTRSISSTTRIGGRRSR